MNFMKFMKFGIEIPEFHEIAVTFFLAPTVCGILTDIVDVVEYIIYTQHRGNYIHPA